ncbi:type I restriction endonuclease subunit R [Flammeovirga kamogawensis]|nr:type I restriction endonuclease subunit R [Flammeovirga kamogawensis]
MYEDDIEQDMIKLLQQQGFDYLKGSELELDYTDNTERSSYKEVVLKQQLMQALKRINPHSPEHQLTEALDAMLNLQEHEQLVETNEEFYKLLIGGYAVEGSEEEDTHRIYYVDFIHPENNEWKVVNQFTVIDVAHCRPDVMLFVNGLPVVVVELKRPTDASATTKTAYDQLQRYKKEIPKLFHYNTLMIISDGVKAMAGSTTAPYSRFLPWKSIDGSTEAAKNKPELEVITKGLLQKDILLELIRDYTVFEKEKDIIELENGKHDIRTQVIKKIAAYHQFFAVRKAIEATRQASSEKGDGKAGVVWHTQGSGKSLSMVFFSKKMEQELDNATLIVLTDRNDLDNQLFNTFASCGQKAEQIESNDDLKQKLKRDSGGMFFTTIQKFGISKEDKEQQTVYEFPQLSDRRNIIIVADEAHRTQYGFTGKAEKDKAGEYTGKISFGFAKYIRDAFPNASFLGFTGTPIEAEDVNTPEVFGNYIDIYDIQQAVEDGATVPIFYESRLAKIKMIEGVDIDSEADKLADEYNVEQEKKEATKLEALIAHPDRLRSVAEDIVSHYSARRAAFTEGKGMIVTMSREIAVKLYDEIIKVKPEWHSDSLDEGAVKVVMTSAPTDEDRYGKAFTKHATTKEQREDLAARVKDVNDPLQLVIVRDMWLTGFDAPCLTTLYVDKPMKGHGLMQAIARVNRVFPGKAGGLVVDYLGIASELKKATKDYTRSGGKGEPVETQNQAVKIVKEKLEVVNDFFREGTFDIERYHSNYATSFERIEVLNDAVDHIQGLEHDEEGTAKRFRTQVMALVKAHSLAVPHPDVMKIEVQRQVAFFHAVKSVLDKLDPSSEPLDQDEKGQQNNAYFKQLIQQLVQDSIEADGVVDILEEAGMESPELSILSDDFLAEVQNMKRKNLAIELLKKLLTDQIKAKGKSNIAKSKKLSERLQDAILRYQNKIISAVEILEEMIALSKEITAEEERMIALGMSATEIAFYDTLADNKSAKDLMEDDTLMQLASVIVENIQKKAKIDWTKREKVKAQLRLAIKKQLKKFGYPPDQQKLATQKILQQTEQLAKELAKAS